MARNLVTALMALALVLPVGVRADILTYSAGPNGHASGMTPQVIDSGDTAEPVTGVPDIPGYHFFNWTWPGPPGSGVVLGTTQNPLAFIGNGSDHEFTANFAADYQSQVTTHGGLSFTTLTLKAGAAHSLVLRDETVYGWGGADGQGAVPNGLAWGVKAIGVGSYHSLGAKTDDTLYAFGKWYNPVTNARTDVTEPADFKTFANSHGGVKSLAGGYGHSLALMNDGRLYAWGDNTYGQGSIPAVVAAEAVAAIAVGDNHNVALVGTNKIISWGRNNEGQLSLTPERAAALGVAVDSSNPSVHLMEGLTFQAVDAKGNHTLALRSDQTVVGWGSNNFGESDVPTGLANVTAIAAGIHHCVALKGDRTVTAWGDNTYGQIATPEGLIDVTSIAAGGHHTSVRVANLAITGWGRNDSGQCDTVASIYEGIEGAGNVTCSPVLVSYGESSVCTATFNYIDYSLASFLVNGVSRSVAGDVATLTDITANQSITVLFSRAPGAPTGGVAVKGDRAAYVTFTPPARIGGGPIRGYTVTSNPPGGTDANAGLTTTTHTVTGLTNGTPYTFTVKAKNDIGEGMASLPSNFVVPKGNQIITIGIPAPGSAVYGTSFTVAATAPGGPVVYSSAGGCTNSGATFTMTSGTIPCTVMYDQSGAAAYNPAVQSVSTVVALKADQMLTLSPAAPASAVYGTSFTAAASAQVGPITYSSAGGCTNSGTAYTMTSGTTACTVTCQAPGNDNYNPASTTSTVAAVKEAQTITVSSAAPASAVYGTTFTVAANSDGGPVSYGSAGGCSNSGGTFTMTSGSTSCTVSYDRAGDSNHTPASLASTVLAVKADQPFTITDPAPSLAAYGSTFTVAATAPGGGIGYSSSGGCTNSGGAFTMTSGTTPCTVRYDLLGDRNYNTASATSTVTAAKVAQGIAITTPAPASAVFGDTFTVTAAATGGAVAYSSAGGCSNSGGTFTMTSGTLPCTVRYDQAGDDDYHTAVRQSSTTTAVKASQVITVTTPAPTSAAFDTNFTVAAIASSGGTVSYSSAGGCTNVGATFTMTSGTTPCIVSIDQPGGSNYYPAAQQTSSIIAVKAPQAITITRPAPSSAGFGSTFTVAAAAPAGPVSYSSAGGCLNNGPVFTMTSATRQCTVRYDQGGNTEYAASAQLSSTIDAVAAVPGAPMIGAVSAANGEATVAYAAPAFDGGSAITGYTVTANPGDITASGTGNHITVTGLNNGTAYTFTVRAFNAAGAGAASTSATAYTPFPNGDLNGDGVVDIGDAMVALRVAVGAQTPTAAMWASGDVAPLESGKPRSDGKIDAGDVVVLLRKTVGLVSW